MSRRTFILLRIHPDHPKVLRVAALTGESPFTVTGRAVAWFRYVDQNFASEHTPLDRNSFNRILGFQGTPQLPPARSRPTAGVDYFTAFQDPDVSWIGIDPAGRVQVVDYEDHFSQSAIRRALNGRSHAVRRATGRPDKTGGNAAETDGDVTNTSPKRPHSRGRNEHLQDKDKKEQAPPLPPAARGEAAAAADSGSELSKFLERVSVRKSTRDRAVAVGVSVDHAIRRLVSITGATDPAAVLASEILRGELPSGREKLSPKAVLKAIKNRWIVSVNGREFSPEEAAGATYNDSQGVYLPVPGGQPELVVSAHGIGGVTFG